jgi:hypothetical protein
MSLSSQAVVAKGADQTIPLMAALTPQWGTTLVNQGTVLFKLLSKDGTTQYGTAVSGTNGTVL